MTRRSDLRKAFSQAKLFLRKGDRYGIDPIYCNTFICHSIDEANAQGKITLRQARMAIALIERRLNGASVVEEFLDQTVGVAVVGAALRADRYVIQTYRHRWLDALIVEFS